MVRVECGSAADAARVEGIALAAGLRDAADLGWAGLNLRRLSYQGGAEEADRLARALVDLGGWARGEPVVLLALPCARCGASLDGCSSRCYCPACSAAILVERAARARALRPGRLSSNPYDDPNP